ncbi:hypothetical protein HC028_08245 [Planosporangium flavigriseum]|uniref:Uncharacterized protein n=1 Tax=Planosporangium flavigriseum TaxID=373681 RepID=A0A8J3PLM7_9ACTN|nr:hypothetical protein [Planosporangium flavigriseum]NJC64496.1 hypothetical protein [Planosporangium flavigriseum]GIG72026.1 hypothetical protein Pfl04_04300 [Planosporangium flavigriseum]
MATVLAAAALVAGPLLHSPAAYAENGGKERRNGSQVDGQTVSFTGGSVLSMLLCRSEPSERRLTVPAQSRVMFVNRLGQKATLRVNGKALVEVGPNQAAPLLFHYGPVSVSMTFACGTNVVEQFSATSISVTPARQPETPRIAAPQPAVSPTPSATPSAQVKAGTSRSGRGVLSPAQPSTGALATVTADSPTATRSRAGAVPSTAASSSGVPLAAGLSAAGGGDDSGKGGGNAVVVEPLVLMSGTPRDTLSGVLALVAAVCVICVTIAVMRAIITKRTNQTYYA